LKTLKPLFPLFFLMGLSVPAAAGTALTARFQSLSDKDAWVKLSLSVDQDRARVDWEGPRTAGSILYNRENSLVTVVDRIHRTVLAVPPDSQGLLRLLGGMAAAKWKSEGDGAAEGPGKAYRLARENARAIFGGTPALKKAGVSLDGFDCDDYVTDGKTGRAREVWVTSPDRAGMDPEDYDTLRSLVHLAVDLCSPELAPWGVDTEDFQEGLSRSPFPVQAVYYAQGKPSARFRVLGIRSESFGDAVFNPPEGYRSLGLLDLLKQGISPDS
jgi:hypothetical protein